MMVLDLTPACRQCGGKGWYRTPDPAGRGEAVQCEVCNPKPIPPFERSALWSVGGARGGFSLWHYDGGRLTLRQVCAPGFFDAAHDFLQNGDRIMVSASDGACDLHVAASTEAAGVLVEMLRSTVAK